MKELNPNLKKLADFYADPNFDYDKAKKELEELEEKLKQEQENEIITPADIQNPQDYIQIPKTNILIAKQEICKDLTWGDTHFELAKNGLFMPTPALFMQHFINVIDAHKDFQNLYDGSGKELTREEIEDIYDYLTSGYKGGCWTWLNVFFEKDKLKIVESVDITNRILNFKSDNLESCLMEGGYVELKFNKQGLPIRKSIEQKEYKQGENIFFHYPEENYVAVFWSVSFGAYLECDKNPNNSDLFQGVFACAIGTQK